MSNEIMFLELVDTIGLLKAEIKEKTEELKKLEKDLKAYGVGYYEGDIFQSKVFDRVSKETMKPDYKKMIEKLLEANKITRQFYTGNSNLVPEKHVLAYTCTAKKT